MRSPWVLITLKICEISKIHQFSRLKRSSFTGGYKHRAKCAALLTCEDLKMALNSSSCAIKACDLSTAIIFLFSLAIHFHHFTASLLSVSSK